MIKRKFYSPVHIKNPTSLQHLVLLQPGQTLIVHLDSENYPNAKMQISTSYLKLLPCEGNKQERQFIVIQDERIALWGSYSSCFLGDIWIDSDKIKAKLVVMLVCVNPVRSNVITAINPDCIDIRVKPFNIFEIILYNPQFKYTGEWTWDWSGKLELGINIEQIGYNFLNSHEEESYSQMYARLWRIEKIEDSYCRQHHFWFRFDESIFPHLNADIGLKYVGDLRFFGWPDRHHAQHDFSGNSMTEYLVSFWVDLRKRYWDETQSTLTVIKHDEALVVGRPSLTAAYNYGYFKKFQQRSFGPKQRKVEFELLNFQSLEEGCVTIDALPSNLDDNLAIYSGQSGRGSNHPHYHYDDFHQQWNHGNHGIYDWWD